VPENIYVYNPQIEKQSPLPLCNVYSPVLRVTSKQMSTACYIHTWTLSQRDRLLNIHLFKLEIVLICQEKNHSLSSYVIELLWLTGSRNNMLLPQRRLLPCDSTPVAEQEHSAIYLSLNKEMMSFYDCLDPHSWVRGRAWEFKTNLLCSFTWEKEAAATLGKVGSCHQGLHAMLGRHWQVNTT